MPASRSLKRHPHIGLRRISGEARRLGGDPSFRYRLRWNVIRRLGTRSCRYATAEGVHGEAEQKQPKEESLQGTRKYWYTQ